MSEDRTYGADPSGEFTDVNSETVDFSDVSLSIDSSVSNTIDPVFETDEQHEFEGSFEVDLDLEQTVVCRHCGEVNGVPNALFCESLGVDPSCIKCGCPLGVVR